MEDGLLHLGNSEGKGLVEDNFITFLLTNVHHYEHNFTSDIHRFIHTFISITSLRSLHAHGRPDLKCQNEFF